MTHPPAAALHAVPTVKLLINGNFNVTKDAGATG